MQSRFIFYWKITYFENLLSRDLQELHARKQARRLANKVFVTLLLSRRQSMNMIGPFKEKQS